jgi:hypothetical protein
MLAKLEAHHERIMAKMDSRLEILEACLGRTGVVDLKVNPEEIRVPGGA